MDDEFKFHQAMLAAIPSLRTHAISMTRDVCKADDLIQSALLRALQNLDQFKPGTDMRAWLFVIMRNLFYSNFRHRKYEVDDPDGTLAGNVGIAPTQHIHMAFGDMQGALMKLSIEQREALMLVAAEGLSYDEAAQVFGTNKGTIKSRVSRARSRLAKLLAFDPTEDFGPDGLVRSALPLY